MTHPALAGGVQSDVASPVVPVDCRRLLELLRAFAGLQELKPAELVVLPFLRELADKLRFALDFRIDVRVDVSLDCPSCVSDRLPLEGALMNLIANARDAMPEGGCLWLGAQACTLADGGCPAVEISVRDSGAGMSAEAMSRVGTPFVTTKSRLPRAGMGLAATNGFVRQSGGTMALHSPVSGGLTVALRLPQFHALE